MALADVKTEVKSFTAQELYNRIVSDEPLFIVDVRNEDDFGRWHVEGRDSLDVANIPYFDFIEDEEAQEPMDAAAKEMLRESMKNALAVLSERERQVLELRFGLVDGKDHTLEEVGQYFNVTRERIRQIESKAMRKLRHPTRSRNLRDFLR